VIFSKVMDPVKTLVQVMLEKPGGTSLLSEVSKTAKKGLFFVDTSA
jgi:hypothetical protein